MPRKKVERTPEQIQADRERMARVRAARLAKETPEQPAPIEEAQPDVVLDLTRDNLINESDLIERIRRMFDNGDIPSIIRVNSKQLLEILDLSKRFVELSTYCSPFGDHEVQVIPAKELTGENI